MSAGAQDSAIHRLPPARPRRRLLRLLLAAVIFAGGLASGYGLATLLNERRIEHHRQHPEEAPLRMVDRLADRLDLSGSQRQQVQAIVLEQWPRLQQIRAQMYPQVQAQMEQFRRKLQEVLTEEQLRAWDRYVSTMARSWQAATQPATQAASAPVPP